MREQLDFNFGTQEMSMVVPPVTFKHTSRLGIVGVTVKYYQVGVLGGGSIKYSATHPFGAEV